jgi:hypothetical protein
VEGPTQAGFQGSAPATDPLRTLNPFSEMHLVIIDLYLSETAETLVAETLASTIPPKTPQDNPISDASGTLVFPAIIGIIEGLLGISKTEEYLSLARGGLKLFLHKLESFLEGTPFKVPVAVINVLIDLAEVCSSSTLIELLLTRHCFRPITTM